MLIKGKDCVGVAVVFFVHDGKGNFVLAKRGAACRDENACWDIGGGAVELHSTVADTLEGEIEEEYGARILDTEFLGYRDVHRKHQDNNTHWITLDFAVLVHPDTVTNKEPHKLEDVRWFNFSTLPYPLHSQLPHFIDIYGEKLLNLKGE